MFAIKRFKQVQDLPKAEERNEEEWEADIQREIVIMASLDHVSSPKPKEMSGDSVDGPAWSI